MQLISRSWNLFRGIAGLLLSIFERHNPEALLEVEKENLRMCAVVLACAVFGFSAWECVLASSWAGRLKDFLRCAGKCVTATEHGY